MGEIRCYLGQKESYLLVQNTECLNRLVAKWRTISLQQDNYYLWKKLNKITSLVNQKLFKISDMIYNKEVTTSLYIAMLNDDINEILAECRDDAWSNNNLDLWYDLLGASDLLVSNLGIVERAIQRDKI